MPPFNRVNLGGFVPLAVLVPGLLRVIDATRPDCVNPASIASILLNEAQGNHQVIHPHGPPGRVFHLTLAETGQLRVDPVDRVTEPVIRDVVRCEPQAIGICSLKPRDPGRTGTPKDSR